MKEGALIRFLIVALPTGLLVLGVAAMVFTQFRGEREPDDPNEAIRLEAAALNRRPVSAEDLSRSVEMLAKRIGERHVGKPEALESAALWLESTLGGGNIGYVVERHAFEVAGGVLRNLVAELPGSGKREEIVVIGTRYDTGTDPSQAELGGSGVAALLALARAFAGDPQERTVRFVAFANGGGETGPESRGSFHYANRSRARGEKVVAMLSLESVGTADGVQSFLGDESARFFLDSARSSFSSVSSLPVETQIPPEDSPSDRMAFTKAGVPSVSISGAGRDIEIGQLEEATRGVEAIVRAWANP